MLYAGSEGPLSFAPSTRLEECILRNLHYAAWILLASVFAACSCGGDEPIATGKPDPRWQSSALSIEACPEGSTVANVQIQNVGTANLDAKLVLTGPHAEMFSLDRYDLVLGRGGGQTIQVTYHPTGDDVSGAQHTAVIEARYKAAGKDEIKPLQLVGDVSNASATPTPSIECAPGVPVCTGDDLGKLCCRAVVDQGSPVSYVTRLSLGGVPFGETAELPIVVKNLGCDTLDVTEATLEFGAGNNTCNPAELTLAAPDRVAGLGSETMTVAFAPRADRLNGCDFTGMLQVKWGGENDDSKMPLSGRAVAPALNVDLAAWYFGDIQPGETSERKFRVWNSGTEDVEIAEVRFQDATGEFRVKKYERCDGTPVAGTPFVLAAGAALPPCGPHEIHLTVEYVPTAPPHRATDTMVIQSSGTAKVSVYLTGGKAPELYSHPGEELVFLSPTLGACDGATDHFSCAESNGCPAACSNDGDCSSGKCLIPDGESGGVCETGSACAVTCGGATRVAQMCNRSSSPLSIRGIEILSADGGPAPRDPNDPSRLVFSAQYDHCTNRSLAQGECCDVAINFQDTSAGGMTGAKLLVHSDDPAHRDGYPMILTAHTRPNQAPINDVDYPTQVMLGEWARFDPSGTWDDRGDVTFEWHVNTVSDSLAKISVGPITPETLAERCDPNHTWPADGCIRLHPDGVVEIYPDRAATYELKLVARDGCGYATETTHRVTARRPGQ